MAEILPPSTPLPPAKNVKKEAPTFEVDDLTLVNQGLAIQGRPLMSPPKVNWRRAKRRKPYPPKGWTRVYLQALAACGIRTVACRLAMVSMEGVKKKRARNAKFKQQEAAAEEEATATLEAVAVQRARAGLNDQLVMFMLKAKRPKTYREVVRTEHAIDPSGSGEGEFTFTLKIGDDSKAEAVAAYSKAHAGNGTNGKVLPFPSNGHESGREDDA